jgi:hypothetical protein
VKRRWREIWKQAAPGYGLRPVGWVGLVTRRLDLDDDDGRGG